MIMIYKDMCLGLATIRWSDDLSDHATKECVPGSIGTYINDAVIKT